MNLLFLGDIVGAPGREAVERYLPRLRESLALDFVVINAENAAHGFGITAQICHELYDLGVDCITTGNHIWDQREIISYIAKDEKLIRPINYPAGAPGRGYTIVENDKGKKLCVINAMTRLFMEPLDDPFGAVEKVLAEVQLGVTVDAIMVDIHGEASSEKMGMGHFCDGFVSLVVGTHTHVPTADAQILNGGTAYQTDAGMCGCYDSIIGMDKDIALNKMIDKVPGERMHPPHGEGTICGVFVEIDDDTGLANAVSPVRMGPRLQEARPRIA